MNARVAIVCVLVCVLVHQAAAQRPLSPLTAHSLGAPVFTELLRDPASQAKGSTVRLECRLEPLNDPTMRVEWFQNGRPITIGSRHRTYYEFGLVALDVLELTTEDSGEYTVRATNQQGTATSSAVLRVV